VDTLSRWLVSAALIGLAVQLFSGMLLSFVYVPSVQLHNGGQTFLGVTTGEVVYTATPMGVDTIPVSGNRFIVHSDTGVLRAPDFHANKKVSINTKPLTEVEKSLQYDLFRVPLGNAFRTLHASAAHATVAMLLLLMLVSVFAGTFATDSARWSASVILLVLVLISTWVGMLLPNDEYALKSAGIVGAAMGTELPFGGMMSDLFGVHSGVMNLHRLFVIHVLLIPALIVAVTIIIRRTKFDGLMYGFAVCVAVIIAVSLWGPTAALPKPHWMFVPAQVLTQWLGTELAGYVVLAVLGAMFTLPLWHARMGKNTPKILVAIVASVFVVTLFM